MYIKKILFAIMVFKSLCIQTFFNIKLRIELLEFDNLVVIQRSQMSLMLGIPFYRINILL